MIVLFKRCRLWIIYGIPAGFLAGFLLLKSGASFPAAVLFGTAVILLSFIAGSIAAGISHGELLSLLYVWLNARKFIERYEPLLKRKNLRDSVLFTLHANLAEGYLACGIYKKALDILAAAPVISGKRSAEYAAILADKRCRIRCMTGETQLALSEYGNFCKALENGARKHTAQKQILDLEAALLRGCAEASSVDVLKERIEYSASAYDALSSRYLLARIADHLGEKELALEQYSAIAETDGDLEIIALARQTVERVREEP